MERIVSINIKRLPEGYYLATSEQIQGLVAQAAGKCEPELPTVSESFEYQLVVGS